MALDIKLLGSGSVNASSTDQELLNRLSGNAVPTDKAAVVKCIRLVNPPRFVKRANPEFPIPRTDPFSPLSRPRAFKSMLQIS